LSGIQIDAGGHCAPIRFLTTAHDEGDVVAIAFRRLSAQVWEHRFLRVEAACEERFQRWLRYLNANGHD
jgi:hypothetical protein